MDPMTMGIIGAGLLGGIAQAYGAQEQANAIKRAGWAQENATRDTLALQDKMHRENLSLQKDMFAFDKQNYEDYKAKYAKWENIFGSMEENMLSYYKNYDNNSIVAKNLQRFNTSIEDVKKNLTASLKQANISENSGTAIQMNKELDLQKQIGMANVINEGEISKQQQKEAGLLSMMQYGASTKPGQATMNTQALANMTSANSAYASDVGNLTMKNADAYGQTVQGIAKVNADMYSGISNSFTDTLLTADYLKRRPQIQQNSTGGNNTQQKYAVSADDPWGNI